MRLFENIILSSKLSIGNKIFLEERLSDVLGQVRRGLDTLGSDQNMTGDRSNGNHTIVS